jgi:hypothetical protein
MHWFYPAEKCWIKKCAKNVNDISMSEKVHTSVLDHKVKVLLYRGKRNRDAIIKYEL